MRASRSILAGVGAAVLVAGLGGCGKRVSYTPTRGQVVLADGKPAEGALVTLVPLDKSGDPNARPSGLVGADGAFTVSTFDPDVRKTYDGAPPGRYAAVVTWFPQARVDTPRKAEGAQEGDKLGGRYADSNTTPFKVEVKDTPTELAPIKVSNSGPRPAAESTNPLGR